MTQKRNISCRYRVLRDSPAGFGGEHSGKGLTSGSEAGDAGSKCEDEEQTQF